MLDRDWRTVSGLDVRGRRTIEEDLEISDLIGFLRVVKHANNGLE